MLCDAVNQACYNVSYEAISSSSSLIKLKSQINVAEASDYRKEASIHKDNVAQYRKDVADFRILQIINGN